MALFIFIIFHLLLEVKSQANLSSVSTSNTTTSLVVTSSTEIITDSITNMSSLSTHDSHSLTDPANGLPQARLTIFPTLATDEEKVHMVCGGHENQHISECMFYPSGQEHLFKPSASCNFSLTGADLITWSQDQESSHVNISCYYTVQGKNGTSPHSDIVSVRVRGLAAMSSLPPITVGSPTTMTPNGTSQANLSSVSTSNTTTSLVVTSSTEIITDSITNMSSLSTHDSHSLTDPANASLESTMLTDTTEHPSVFPLMTEGPEIKKYSNTKMFFFIAVVASGGGIVLTGLVGICLYGCTRKSKAERIWIEFNRKKLGQSLPTASSETTLEEDAVLYSTLKFMQSPSQPPGNSEESRQTEVEPNHLYCTILTKPAISSDSRSVYSQLKIR